MTTLEYNGAEKTLGDWDIFASPYKWKNDIGQDWNCTMALNFDAPDPFPFRAKIILRVGRAAGVNAANPSLPETGAQAFSGGKIVFIGYLPRRGKRRRDPDGGETISFRFVDAFIFCFGRLTFRKSRRSYNGAMQTVVNDAEVVLGYSANFDFSDTNYLSLRQQLCEITAWAALKSALEFGAAQFQFDTLTHALDLKNYDLLQNPTPNCSIPDYVPGTYGNIGASGASLGTCLNPNGLVLRPSLDGVNNVKCNEAFRRTLDAIGGPGKCAVWFDYSQKPPMLKVFTRDAMPAVTLPFLGQPEEMNIEARDDLVPNAVDLLFHILYQQNGTTYLQVVRDVAATIGGVTVEGIGIPGQLTNLLGAALGVGIEAQLVALGEGTQSIDSTVDIDGGAESSTTTSALLACIPADFGDPASGPDPAALACWQFLYPDFASVTNLKQIDPATFTDPVTSLPIDPSPYSYVVTKGGVASWMFNGPTQGISAKVRIAASFSYDTATPGKAANHPIVVDAVLTNLPSNTYASTSVSQYNAGEEPPYGLAGYIFNIEKILQFQGNYSFVEQDVTAAVGPGVNLNLSGGLAEWLTMNAYLTEIEYNFDAGKTTLTFGPAAHLGAQGLVDAIRRDRGPRGVLFYNANILNTSS